MLRALSDLPHPSLAFICHVRDEPQCLRYHIRNASMQPHDVHDEGEEREQRQLGIHISRGTHTRTVTVNRDGHEKRTQ